MRGGTGVGALTRGGIGVGALIRGAGAAIRAAGAVRDGAGFAVGAPGAGAGAGAGAGLAPSGGGGFPRIVWAGMRRGGGGSWKSSGGACVRVASSSSSIAGSDGKRGIGRAVPRSMPFVAGFWAMRTDADGSEIGARSARGTGRGALSPIGRICGRARGCGGGGRG